MKNDFIFLGIPGCGKSVQAKIIAEKFGAELFKVGAELRRLANENPELAWLQPILDRGEIVRTDFVQQITNNFIAKVPDGKPIIFDGAGRMLPEKTNLDQIYPRGERELKLLFLKIDPEKTWQRIQKRNEERPEDASRETFDIRMANFERETRPVIDAFSAENRAIEIDADQPEDAVTAAIIAAVK